MSVLETTYVWSASLGFIVIALICLWTAFWLIRLAVRYGVQDALRQHRQLTEARERGDER